MRTVVVSFAVLCVALFCAPLAHAAQGYDVFRPWDVAPAACPGTCSGAESAGSPVALKAWYDAQAAAHPGLVDRVVYGTAHGADLVAYKVGSGAPAMYVAGQHARDWLGVELNRRLFAYALAHPVAGTALWFIPVADPAAYDASFASKAARLDQPVDLDRNWPETFHYDDEGSGPDRGAGPASEPAVAALDDLLADVRPAYLIDYQSGGGRILYPEAWQIGTPATDAPAFEALAGDDDHPAIAGYDPDVAGEVATANGTLIDHAYARYGTQAFTVALADGSGPGVGGTVDGADAYDPGGAVFQDSETDVQAEYAKGQAFALDLARSAPDPSAPDSHLGNTAPDFVAHTFPLSYGTPQTVEVDARRALGAVAVHWKVDGGAERSAALTEYAGGERYGAPGAVYHRMRGTVTGFKFGQRVDVWFDGGGRRSASFAFTAAQEHPGDVLVLAAEDYTGTHPAPPHPGPEYLRAYTDALTTLGRSFDVYDTDARGRVAPDALGVLSHYRAVIWYTGDDVFVRDAAQPDSTGASRLLGEEVLAARDYLNDGGKLLVTGSSALQAVWRQLDYNPVPGGPYCQYNNLHGLVAHDHPIGQTANCLPISDDFMQYYLGAWQMIDVSPAPPFAGFTVDGDVEEFITTGSMSSRFPSRPAVLFASPDRFAPPSGTQYAYAASSDEGYATLTRTVDLTSATAASLRFKFAYDTEAGFDHVFVAAHELGQNDWTTLPDRNGRTGTSTDEWCLPDWETLHPFLDHFIAAAGCARTGATGTWNAATGNSGGFHEWDVDLSAWHGKQVEVAITYAQDYGNGGLGAYVDDARVERDGATISDDDFEHGLGGWTGDGWVARDRVVDAPGIATDDTQLWGFGLEDVDGDRARAKVLGDALTTLIGAQPKTPPTDDDDGGGGPTGGGGTAPTPPDPPVSHDPPAAPAPQLLGVSRSRGLVKARVTCSVACKGALKLRHGGKAFATRSYSLKAGKSATITLKVAKRYRGRKVTLSLYRGAKVVTSRSITVR